MEIQALRFHYSKCLQQSWNKWREVRQLTGGEKFKSFLFYSDGLYPYGYTLKEIILNTDHS